MKFKNFLKKIALTSAIAFALVSLAFGQTSTVAAACSDNYDLSGGMGCAQTGDMSTDTSPGTAVGKVTQILMYAVGIISVIIIIMAGITYATASGDESKTKKARTAMLGGIIGLAIALLAWTLTNFVFTQFK